MGTVRDTGPLGARLVLIGEAPGDEEMARGVPLVGNMGKMLMRWLAAVGIERADCYLTNVLTDRAVKPSHAHLIPRDMWEAGFEALHERLALLDDPWLLVPMGNYALYGLTGKGKVPWDQRDRSGERPGITAYRGSILSYVDRRGRTIKVIPTLLPAAVWTTPLVEHTLVRYDWPRIAIDRQFRALATPVCEHVIHPTLDDLDDYVARTLEHGRILSVDIETPLEKQKINTEVIRPSAACICKHPMKRHDGACLVRRCACAAYTPKASIQTRTKTLAPYIACVGFAADARHSMTIPTTLAYWREPDALAAAWERIDALLQSPIVKVMQNGAAFDAYHFGWERGALPRAYVLDTRWMHRHLDPALPHDLAYLGSIHTRFPYWKAEAKDPEAVSRYASNLDALLTYNGIDCCATAEIAVGPRDIACEAPLLARLVTEGLWPSYLQNYGDMLDVIAATSLVGVRVDRARAHAAVQTLDAERATLREAINVRAGFPLFKTSALSKSALFYYLYGAAGLPEKSREAYIRKLPAGATSLNLPLQRAKRKTAGGHAMTLSADEVTIRKLARRFPGQFAEMAADLLRDRELAQQRQFFDLDTDDDGRLRCSFSFVSNGRMESRSNARGTGRNLQNIIRSGRGVFVPG